ncbi:hypothetical protein GF377_00905 [candidate division GN15 bacterium]|nr:hypothetical protein [candidate division GN15 bacterium]
MTSILKKSGLFVVVILAAFALWSCGGDDDDNGTDPGPTTPRVTAVSAASAPNTVNSAQWNNATETQIEITAISFTPKIAGPRSSVLATTDSIGVKAMVFNNTLYMRFDWADATDDHWPRRFEMTGWSEPSPGDSLLLFLQDTLTQFEDQLLMMFQENDSTWDCWNWRRVTTGGGGLAEGMNIVNDVIDVDENLSSAAVVRSNAINTQEPIYMQPDSSDRTDAYLLYESAKDTLDRESGGWTVGQLLAGVIVDSTLKSTPGNRNSQWDVDAVSTYAGGRHTVVLSRPLNTGHQDDMVFGPDQLVVVRLGVTNNANFSLTTGNTNQGFSQDFELLLP